MSFQQIFNASIRSAICDSAQPLSRLHTARDLSLPTRKPPILFIKFQNPTPCLNIRVFPKHQLKMAGPLAAQLRYPYAHPTLEGLHPRDAGAGILQMPRGRRVHGESDRLGDGVPGRAGATRQYEIPGVCQRERAVGYQDDDGEADGGLAALVRPALEQMLDFEDRAFFVFACRGAVWQRCEVKVLLALMRDSHVRWK